MLVVLREMFLIFIYIKHKEMSPCKSTDNFWEFKILKPKDVKLYITSVLKIAVANAHKQWKSKRSYSE
jgi:hypothetical protein